MINRTAKEALLRLASQFPVIGVTGPRQSGKSTLTKAVFPDKRYITFDDRTMRELALSNPSDFIAAFPDGAIIDEAQKVPEIFDALKMYIDSSEFKPGKFVLTGSSQFRLKQNMTDSMAGRVAFLKLLPFSVKELKDADEAQDKDSIRHVLGTIETFIGRIGNAISSSDKKGKAKDGLAKMKKYFQDKGQDDLAALVDKYAEAVLKLIW
jgi:predicted AAA+ superfamily ATPase